MRGKRRVRGAVQLLMLAGAFVVSIYAVSNLMPLILRAVATGLSVADGFLMVGYWLVGVITIAILAREIYRLDKRAGRVRNKVGWFE